MAMSGKRIHTRIAGFNHHEGSSTALMTLKPGRRVKLVPEPTNRHDKNAIEVRRESDGLMLGYVPRDCNERILGAIKDRDLYVYCERTAETFNAIAVVICDANPLD